MKIDLVELDLSKVNDGALDDRFRELVDEVLEIHANAAGYASGQDGIRKTVIKAEIEFHYKPSINGDPASTTIISGAEISKRPKRIKNAQPAYTKDGKILVEDHPAEQIEAFKGEGSGGVISRLPAASNGSTESNA